MEQEDGDIIKKVIRANNSLWSISKSHSTTDSKIGRLAPSYITADGFF